MTATNHQTSVTAVPVSAVAGDLSLWPEIHVSLTLDFVCILFSSSGRQDIRAVVAALGESASSLQIPTN